LGEQPLIEGNRLEWTAGICAGVHRVRRRGVCQDPALHGRAPLEILIGFLRGGIEGRRPISLYFARSASVPQFRECLGGLRSGHFPWPGIARAYPELLLELQVRQTTHRLRCHRSLRCLLEEAPVVL